MESNTLPLCQLLIGLNKKKKDCRIDHHTFFTFTNFTTLSIDRKTMAGYIFEIRVEGLVIRSKYLPNMQKRSKRHKFAIIITSIALC